MGTSTGRFGTAFFAFITGVVVPVVVQIVANNYKIALVIPSATPSTAMAAPAHPIAALPSELKINAQGIGRSAEDAWHDALHRSLQNAAASLVDGQTWSQSGPLICQQVLHDEKSLILRCEDGRCAAEGGVWRRDVTVVVSRNLLTDSLKSYHWRVVTDAQ